MGGLETSSPRKSFGFTSSEIAIWVKEQKSFPFNLYVKVANCCKSAYTQHKLVETVTFANCNYSPSIWTTLLTESLEEWLFRYVYNSNTTIVCIREGGGHLSRGGGGGGCSNPKRNPGLTHPDYIILIIFSTLLSHWFRHTEMKTRIKSSITCVWPISLAVWTMNKKMDHIITAN